MTEPIHSRGFWISQLYNLGNLVDGIQMSKQDFGTASISTIIASRNLYNVLSVEYEKSWK